MLAKCIDSDVVTFLRLKKLQTSAETFKVNKAQQKCFYNSLIIVRYCTRMYTQPTYKIFHFHHRKFDLGPGFYLFPTSNLIYNPILHKS